MIHPQKPVLHDRIQECREGLGKYTAMLLIWALRNTQFPNTVQELSCSGPAGSAWILKKKVASSNTLLHFHSSINNNTSIALHIFKVTVQIFAR